MANFPETFTEDPTYLHITNVAPRFAEPMWELENKGFVVVAGLRRSDVPALTEIANQPGVREFCPNDIARRWTDEPTTEKQLAKDGGRGVFRLEHVESGATAAFGWTGRASDDEYKITHAQHTFAVRVNERFQGKHLATPFSLAIVAGSMALYRAKGIGLETWASNTGAVKAYLGANAVLMGPENGIRPTLDESFPVDLNPESEFVGKRTRPDTRLYMQYPQSM